MKQKQWDEFLILISKLNAEEFLGMAHLLKVELMNGDNPKDFTDMLSECLSKIEKLNRAERRNLLRILRAATKEEN